MTQLDTTLERFWPKVAKSDECWEWMAGRFPSGYGAFEMNGRTERAHRASWILNRGPIPDGLLVLHRCDNPACVRPDHLFLGTHQDNHADRHAKGRDARGATHGSRTKPERLARGDRNGSRVHPERVPRGEKSHFAKLTANQVRDIRHRSAEGELGYRLAEEYGLTTSGVSRILLRKNWKHIT